MAQPLPIPSTLPSPPTDGITSLSYLAATSLLASSSWDGSLRIHDAAAKTALVSKSVERPLLSLATQKEGSESVFCGGIDGSIHKLDVEKDSVSFVGVHSDAGSSEDKKMACSCLAFANGESTLLASAGWNGKFSLWDVRWNKRVASIDLPGKAFDMDVSRDCKMAVVATSGRRNCLLDLRTSKILLDDQENASDDEAVKVMLDRESSLKYQTRCVRFFPNGVGLAVGSIEGRVAIEYLDDVGIASGKKKYAFKCHRISDTIYPVNTIAFHPEFGTFATGGADGTVVTWDGNSKKKISSIAKLPTSVACVAFNHDGTQIAMASSYTFEEGERDHPRDEIFVREVLESEVKPKGVSK
eukprot:CCRYP_004814-RA/>CCRYP_004814-RA protein AED:0.07 eAED:0.07 QI:379/1/1/1/1/1/2/381/355